MRCESLLAGVVLLAAAPVWAQTPPLSPVPRLEVGVHVGALATKSEEGGLGVLGIRLTANLTRRITIEIIVEGPAPQFRPLYLHGLYFLQGKFAIPKPVWPRTTLYGTVGFVGGYSYYRSPEWRHALPDGSTVVYHAYSLRRVSGLEGFGGGYGVQHILSRHLAVRAEAQVYATRGWLGFRGVGGISIPIGSYTVTVRGSQ